MHQSLIACHQDKKAKLRAGQILLELDSDITRTELQQAQAKLEGLQNRGNNNGTINFN